MYLKEEQTKVDLRSISMAFRFRSRRMPQIFAAFAETLSAFGMGTVEAYTSPALPDMEKGGELGKISEDEYAHVASFALMAALAAGIPTGILLEKVGRKATIMFLSIPFVTGWLMISFAVNLTMIDIGRILTGFCAGGASMAVPVFLGEVAEDSIRGFLGSSFQFQVSLGNLFVYVLGKYMNWHWLAFACSVVILLALILMSVVPPSPRFLISKGRLSDAARALVWLRGASSVNQVEDELLSIKSSVEATEKDPQELRYYFQLPILRPLFITLLLLFFQQMTGVEAILVFTLDIFRISGSFLDPHTSVIIVGGLQVLATFFSALIVDKAGRRKLLLISSIGSSIAMGVLGFYFYDLKEKNHSFPDVGNESISSTLNWLPLLTLSIFIISFSLGLGPIPFIMLAELNNSRMIGIVSALATTFNWTFASLVTRFFLTLARSLGFHHLFWIFSGISVLGAVFIFIFVPETSGKSFHEIQKYFKAI